MDVSEAIDISMELNEETLVWIEDPQPELRAVLRQPADPVNFTWLSFSAHAGSHVDAPFFLYPESWSSDQIPLDRMIGPAQVLDLTHVDDLISVCDLEKLTPIRSRILMRTRNSFDPLRSYNPDHVALSTEAAQWLLDNGVETLGYDYQSFERGGSNEIHSILLKERVTVIDNLRLADAAGGNYTLLCLPLRLTGIDAAPCRALLFPEVE